MLFLLLSVFFLIRWMQSDLSTNQNLFCAGLAAGLAAGTKMSMLQPAFAIALVATAAAVSSRHVWKDALTKFENDALNWAWMRTQQPLFFHRHCWVGVPLSGT